MLELEIIDLVFFECNDIPLSYMKVMLEYSSTASKEQDYPFFSGGHGIIIRGLRLMRLHSCDEFARGIALCCDFRSGAVTCGPIRCAKKHSCPGPTLVNTVEATFVQE